MMSLLTLLSDLLTVLMIYAYPPFAVSFREIIEHAKSFNRVNRSKVASTESVQHQKEEKLSDSGSLESKSADPLQESIKRGT